MTDSRTAADFLAWIASVTPFDEVRLSDDGRDIEAWRDGEKVGSIVIRQDEPKS
jgi:hypothetical protein